MLPAPEYNPAIITKHLLWCPASVVDGTCHCAKFEKFTVLEILTADSTHDLINMCVALKETITPFYSDTSSADSMTTDTIVV